MPPSPTAPATVAEAPHLRYDAGVARLVVDGRPYLVRGAEVHNSAASTARACRTSFAAAVRVGANTVLAPVTWEAVAPAEGVVELDLVDTLVQAAREAGLRLVILWFGAFKNGASSYAPGWVKTDPARFPRARDAGGAPTATLSPFAASTRDADAHAFAAVADHVERIDAAERTVLMFQVQNEPGLLGSSRDHSAGAEELFAAAPPRELLGAVGVEGPHADWVSAFGAGANADEHFMAWGFASYADAVARAGRQHTSLPFFTNAWLDSVIDLPGFALAGGQQPGSYPSGGPVARMLPIWRAFAPHVDLVAPDIYFGDFSEICATYSRASRGLFIPEMRRDSQGVGDLFLAIGEHRAIGVSPFGVDSITDPEAEALRDAYELLAALDVELDPSRAVRAFHLPPTAPSDARTVLDLGDVEIRATRLVPLGDTAPPEQGAFGVVVRVGPDRFLAVGRGFGLTFHDPRPDSSRSVGILSVLEHPREPADGTEARPVLRRLNGDETAGGTAWLHPARDQRQSEVFPIPMAVEHSGVSSCEIYWLD